MSSAVGESPLPYMPWVGGEFRWRLGMRPLDLADWIQIGDDYDAQMATKQAARTGHPATVFVALPEALPACAEVLELLLDHLGETWPDDFARTGGEIVNRRTGERLPLDGSVHPLDIAGRLVQEDLIVMVTTDPPDGTDPDGADPNGRAWCSAPDRCACRIGGTCSRSSDVRWSRCTPP